MKWPDRFIDQEMIQDQVRIVGNSPIGGDQKAGFGARIKIHLLPVIIHKLEKAAVMTITGDIGHFFLFQQTHPRKNKTAMLNRNTTDILQQH